MHNAGAGLVWGAAIGLLDRRDPRQPQPPSAHEHVRRRHHAQRARARADELPAQHGRDAPAPGRHPHDPGAFATSRSSASRCSPSGGPVPPLRARARSCGGSMQRRRWGSSCDRSARTHGPPTSAASTSTGGGARRCCGAARSRGFGGAFLSVGEVGTFNSNMTAGRGFIVIAAVIFGGWTLRGTIAGCFLFGGADALRTRAPRARIHAQSAAADRRAVSACVIVMCFFAQRAVSPRRSRSRSNGARRNPHAEIHVSRFQRARARVAHAGSIDHVDLAAISTPPM